MDDYNALECFMNVFRINTADLNAQSKDIISNRVIST